jgi:hypothetical protein
VIRAWGRKKEFQIMGYSANNKESKGSGANPSASAVIKEGVSTTTANPVQQLVIKLSMMLQQ